jgi:hypothetical protein
MSRRLIALVAVSACLTVTPAMASHAPTAAPRQVAGPTTATNAAMCAAAHRLGVMSPRLARVGSSGCQTPNSTPATPPTPNQLVCGPTLAGLNDECPDWASAPLPEATTADRTNTAIMQSAIPGDGIDATQPSVLSGSTLYSVGTCTGGPCGPIGGLYGAWANVDGTSTGDSPGSHGVLTAAYDAYSGALDWLRTYDAGSKYESATSVAATRQAVFTLAEHTTDAWWPTGTYASHLLAYRHDGKPMWRVTIARQLAQSNVVNAAGDTVYVSGTRVQPTSSGECRIDAVVTAFASATGRREWQSALLGKPGKCSSQSGSPSGSIYGNMVATSGNSVYLSATRIGSDWFGKTDVFAGFNARTGAKVFQSEYTPPTVSGTPALTPVLGSNSCDLGASAPMLLSPDGHRAFLNTFAECPVASGLPSVGSLTLAFDTHSGHLIWHAMDNGGAANDNQPWVDHPMTMSPDGQDLIVSGYSSTAFGTSVYDGFATTSYRADTGRQLWSTRYAFPGQEHQTMCVFCGPSLAHTTNAIVVSGYFNGGYNEGIPYTEHPQNATVGLNPKTGAQMWVALDQPWDRTDSVVIGADLVTNPHTRAVYAITGTSKAAENLGIRVLGYHATN